MYYGFDVGGTKIEFGAFNEKLERVATERVPTPTDNYELLVDTIAELVNKYDAEFGCEGTIGLGLPGMEDADDATVLTVNVPAAKGKPLRADLEAKIGRSVKIENDANCFALSEAWDEELQDEPSVLGLILGTGFGGGFIYDGKVFSGRNHVAGEVGHTRLPIDAWFHLGENAPLLGCGCDKKGCLDSYLSGRASSCSTPITTVKRRKRSTSLKRTQKVRRKLLSTLSVLWSCWLSVLQTSLQRLTHMLLCWVVVFPTSN